MAFVLGITGGICTGKSTVLKMLGDLGARILSADDVARDVLRKDSPAYREVVERFGERILADDGEIDRAGLARIIFGDALAREALNQITHPRIIGAIQDRIDQFRQSPPSPEAVLAVEIPLLVECGMEGMVDEVLLVAAEQETQLNRLTSRSGVSEDEAVQRIGAQMPLARKTEHADRVIVNDGSIESLERSVRRVWEEILLP